MGLLKLIIAAIVILCIIVLVREFLQRRSKEKLVENLTAELDDINDGSTKTDLEIDVVDAKTELKAKRAVLAEKTDELNTPTPPPGRTVKEGEQPPKPDTTVEAPEFDTTTESFEPTKVAPKKKVAKKKVAKKKVTKKKAAPKTGKK